MKWLEAAWPAPSQVVAGVTTREAGASQGVYAAGNVGDHVGDQPGAVTANRQRLRETLPGLQAISWLTQVHGTDVVAASAEESQRADAQYSVARGLGCAVMSADCLPVLFCNQRGDWVAAAHAGWRGLAAGVLEATVARYPGDPAELLAWLGPAISAARFEVGPEVRDAFAAVSPGAAACFIDSPNPGRYLGNLYALARQRLSAAGLTGIHGGGFCTYMDGRRFYSYRRDGETGRMASLVYLR